jgi:CRP-like cAMP-binding protein
VSNYFNKIIFNLNKEPIILNKNKTLFNQDDSVNGIYFVIEGLIKVTQVDRSNKIIFTRLTLPLDTVGHRSIFTQKTYLGTAEIISDTAKVIFISTDEIIKLMSTNVEFSRESE